MLVLAGTLAVPEAAAAQAPAPEAESDRYRALIDDALAEYAAGRHLEARALFAQAHALRPSARTLRGLGLVAFELRRYAESVGYLEQALASEENPLTGTLRSDAEQLLARANGFVARVHVAVEPSHAQVRLDGANVVVAHDSPLLLDIGEHVLEAEAPGLARATRPVQVLGGETLRLALRLAPQAAALSPAHAAATLADEPGALAHHTERPTARPLYKRPWLWVGIGAVAAVAAGVTAGLLASRSTKTVVSEPEVSDGAPLGVVFDGLGRRP